MYVEYALSVCIIFKACKLSLHVPQYAHMMIPFERSSSSVRGSVDLLRVADNDLFSSAHQVADDLAALRIADDRLAF